MGLCWACSGPRPEGATHRERQGEDELPKAVSCTRAVTGLMVASSFAALVGHSTMVQRR